MIPATLSPGLKHRESMIVGPGHLVPGAERNWLGFRDMPPVFATAMMVGFMEQTCIQALRPYLAAGQHSVGVQVDMTHIAATAEGMRVTAEVELAAIEGKTLIFHVACFDDAGLIGQGSHRRALIDVARFMQRLQAKAQAL